MFRTTVHGRKTPQACSFSNCCLRPSTCDSHGAPSQVQISPTTSQVRGILPHSGHLKTNINLLFSLRLFSSLHPLHHHIPPLYIHSSYFFSLTIAPVFIPSWLCLSSHLLFCLQTAIFRWSRPSAHPSFVTMSPTGARSAQAAVAGFPRFFEAFLLLGPNLPWKVTDFNATSTELLPLPGDYQVGVQNFFTHDLTPSNIIFPRCQWDEAQLRERHGTSGAIFHQLMCNDHREIAASML